MFAMREILPLTDVALVVFFVVGEMRGVDCWYSFSLMMVPELIWLTVESVAMGSDNLCEIQAPLKQTMRMICSFFECCKEKGEWLDKEWATVYDCYNENMQTVLMR